MKSVPEKQKITAIIRQPVCVLLFAFKCIHVFYIQLHNHNGSQRTQPPDNGELSSLVFPALGCYFCLFSLIHTVSVQINSVINGGPLSFYLAPPCGLNIRENISLSNYLAYNHMPAKQMKFPSASIVLCV